MSIDNILDGLFNSRPLNAILSNRIYLHEGHWEIAVYSVVSNSGSLYSVAVRLHDAKIIAFDENRHSFEFDTVDEMLSAIREAE